MPACLMDLAGGRYLEEGNSPARFENSHMRNLTPVPCRARRRLQPGCRKRASDSASTPRTSGLRLRPSRSASQTRAPLDRQVANPPLRGDLILNTTLESGSRASANNISRTRLGPINPASAAIESHSAPVCICDTARGVAGFVSIRLIAADSGNAFCDADEPSGRGSPSLPAGVASSTQRSGSSVPSSRVDPGGIGSIHGGSARNQWFRGATPKRFGLEGTGRTSGDQ